MAKKDKILLIININVATAVHSSIKVVPLKLKTFKEVSTKKQMPSKLADVLRIWGALLFSAIKIIVKQK